MIKKNENNPESKHSILVVEDEAVNQIAMKAILRNKYEVYIASTAKEAREILKQNKIDLILMDISLKGEENGLELTTELKKNNSYKELPIIIVTAHAFEVDKNNSLEAGADDYIAKPYNNKELLKKIEGHLRFNSPIQ